ncbi:PhzF family phenazine biosynthesis protein [Herbiconiux sp. CPCC 203407]|uniref:PhzF family phenazine biosynthesis protein n=1 Tax=Herbiconiux oxytropis TaxID=2970915 RepID=A0AA42BVA8_9MICO|nr:PhzF family phenazine biosynthesis protein [Herbiconiux oxytropis]MCS5723280.1 PhzF family phenazine biosynthesis protein [Herbiconiux oxytropis]MCS5727822.1 PhzF family phenazine biosynthesis protein [Herbiconiux oxytropis]
MDDSTTGRSPDPDRDLDIRRLSAFAAEPGGGNPAGVVLDASGLSDERMLAVAAEVGFSETAFVTEPAIDGDPRHVRVRYFSPDAEVPFCGHATIATSVLLAADRGVGAFVLETEVGAIAVTTAPGEASGGSAGAASRAASGLVASFVSVEPSVRMLPAGVEERLLGLLGLTAADLDPRWPVREAFAGNRHPVVPLASEAVFDAFAFDPGAVRALMDEQGWKGTVTVVLLPAAAGPGAGSLEVEARNLFPVGDITEDPATGSAAASLGGYLRELGAVRAPARVLVHQGRHVGRPSVLAVEVPETGGIAVGGGADPLD